MSEKRGFDCAGNRTGSAEPIAKRKFIPNLKNAVNKAVVSKKPPRELHNKERVDRPGRVDKGASRLSGGRDNKPQFIQSYSIFESGIGCVVKSDKNAVELREARTIVKQADTLDIHEAESKEDLLDHCQSFVTDIKQVFKDPPILMQDSAAGVQTPVDPLKNMDLSEGRNHQLPHEFFSNCGSGRLFSLHLPDKLLPSDLEQVKAGPFGKIQLLDNQQARLVIGGATFELISSRPLATSSDVVLMEQRSDEFIRLNCLGHLDQAMLAVPDLENFVKTGQ